MRRPTAWLAASALLLLVIAGCSTSDGERAQQMAPPRAAERSDDAKPPAPRDRQRRRRERPRPGEQAAPADRPRLAKVDVRLQPIAALTDPTAMAVREGDDAIYVSERDGHIRAVRAGRPTLLLDITGRTRAGGERGLLGIVFSRDGSHLYVSYIGRDTNSHIDEYAMDGDRVDRASRREVLTVQQPDHPEATVHKGGNLVFGPDGLLYIGFGDGGPSREPPQTAQAMDTLLGKLVRIDPTASGKRGYRIPDDNPFVGRAGARPEIYALGLRNPWRFSFDAATADLWLADVGRYVVEEIDFLPPRAAAGANLGWDRLEGTLSLSGSPPPDAVPPIHEYNHDDGRCAIVGGFVYRGQAIPALRGAYLYGDYCDGVVRALVERRGKVVKTQPLGPQVEALSSFGQDLDGELYVLSLTNGLFRLVPAR